MERLSEVPMQPRKALVGLAALAALACTGCDPKLLQATLPPSPTPSPIPGANTTLPKVPTGDPRGPAVDGWRAVSLYGLTVDVPATWPVNAVSCSTPQRDTVIIEAYVGPACAQLHAPKVDSVTLRPYHRFVDPQLVPTSKRAIDGVPADIVTSPEQTTVVVKALQAVVEIKVRDQGRAQRILDSVRVVSTDAHGCQTHRRDTNQLPTGRAPANITARTVLVPAGPASVTTCGYDDDGLRVGAQMNATGARSLAAAINTAPPGGSLNHVDGDCSEEGAPSYVATFTYDNQPDVTVWIRVDGCGVLGASNGSVVHQRTDDLMWRIANASGLTATSWHGTVIPITD